MKAQLLTMSQLASSVRRRSWGPWLLDTNARTIYTNPDSHVGYRYEIDLERCRTSAEVLDWICQIAGKCWGEPPENAATIAGLVAAFDDVLHPQANLCSWGESKTLTRADIRRLVARVDTDREGEPES